MLKFYPCHVLKVLKIIRPKLAAGFKKQKGPAYIIYTLWNYDESVEYSVSHMDTHKLEKTLIHNLAVERKLRALDQKPSAWLSISKKCTGI